MAKDMTSGKPLKLIWNFTIPLLIGNLFQQLYNMADTFIVGRTIGVHALAAVGSTGSIVFLIIGFATGLTAGLAIPLAQRFGAKDYKGVKHSFYVSILISIATAIVLTALSMIFCRQILEIMQTPSEIIDGAYDYLIVIFGGIFSSMAYNLLSNIFRSIGDAKTPLYFLVMACVMNIILDILFIAVFGMGVEGAGIATFLSQVFASSLCWWFIKRHMTILVPIGDERQFDNKRISILLNNGIPMGLQFSITSIGIIMLQSANNALGTVYVASFTAAIRIKYLFTCVLENIGVAMATYCGQNLGAKRLQRIKTGVNDAMWIMMAYFVLTVIIIYPFADEMMMIFVNGNEKEVIANAAQLMRISNWFYPSLGVLVILRYSIQGLGYSNLSMMSGVMEMIARCGVSIWLVPALAWIGVCYADPVAWIMADIFLIPAYIWLIRRLKRQIG